MHASENKAAFERPGPRFNPMYNTFSLKFDDLRSFYKNYFVNAGFQFEFLYYIL